MADLLNINELMWPLVTAFAIISARDAFPRQPKIFEQLQRNELIKWFMVFLLIWQGGGQRRVDLSIVATIVVFVIYKLFDGAFGAGLAACQVQPATPAVTAPTTQA